MASGFCDRQDAGKQLARALVELESEDAVVLGLPRGGVPVAFEVAVTLCKPLDVIVVRKLGVPFQPELAMGAIGEDGVVIVNHEVRRMVGVDELRFSVIENVERKELETQALRFRGQEERVVVAGRTAIVVDDGIATGSTARAACEVVRAHGARRVVLAVPVAPPSAVEELVHVADEFVCLESPEPFFAVGYFYADFSPTTDDEVVALLRQARERLRASQATTN